MKFVHDLPQDAVYGIDSKPAGHLLFSYLTNSEGMPVAGHCDLLEPGEPALMELPREVPHLLKWQKENYVNPLAETESHEVCPKDKVLGSNGLT